MERLIRIADSMGKLLEGLSIASRVILFTVTLVLLWFIYSTISGFFSYLRGTAPEQSLNSSLMGQQEVGVLVSSRAHLDAYQFYNRPISDGSRFDMYPARLSQLSSGKYLIGMKKYDPSKPQKSDAERYLQYCQYGMDVSFGYESVDEKVKAIFAGEPVSAEPDVIGIDINDRRSAPENSTVLMMCNNSFKGDPSKRIHAKIFVLLSLARDRVLDVHRRQGLQVLYKYASHIALVLKNGETMDDVRARFDSVEKWYEKENALLDENRQYLTDIMAEYSLGTIEDGSLDVHSLDILQEEEISIGKLVDARRKDRIAGGAIVNEKMNGEDPVVVVDGTRMSYTENKREGPYDDVTSGLYYDQISGLMAANYIPDLTFGLYLETYATMLYLNASDGVSWWEDKAFAIQREVETVTYGVEAMGMEGSLSGRQVVIASAPKIVSSDTVYSELGIFNELSTKNFNGKIKGSLSEYLVKEIERSRAEAIESNAERAKQTTRSIFNRKVRDMAGANAGNVSVRYTDIDPEAPSPYESALVGYIRSLQASK